MSQSLLQVGVVVQTHWDREWYWTREQFVARLLRVMEAVAGQLERGELEHFLFDGQVAAMEDLLAHAEPALIGRVLSLVQSGRIALGPWYVMADEFLVSGESLLRNLEIGMADAQALGNCQRVGYLPDSFGHVAQMPQLLQQMGIPSAVLWRGADAANSEFDWVAPDGTRVGSLFLSEGYYQHPFNLDDWQPALQRYLEQVAPRALSEHLLLPQGGDHLMPRAGLHERIAEFNAGQSRYRLEQQSLQQHVALSLAASDGRRPELCGELRNNARAFVLPDVLSTRRYLKLAHQQSEDRLLGAIEPLYAALDVPQPDRYLEQCWRLLIQQQAHDSICGCSIDEVHAEMETRFELLQQKLDTLEQRALVDAGMLSACGTAHADDAAFTLFNPLPVAREGWHRVELFLAGDVAEGLQVRDVQGQVLPSLLLGSVPHSEFRSPLDDFPAPLAGHRYELLLHARLGGLQARRLQVKSHAQVATVVDSKERIHLDSEGRLWLDLTPGTRVQVAVLSELDAGDSYNYSPPPDAARRLHQRWTLLRQRKLGPLQDYVLRIEARLPARLDAARQGPCSDEVLCHGRLRLKVLEGQVAIEASLDWDNQAEDQRSRLLFSLPTLPEHTEADSAFAWLRRASILADYPAAPSRREMPPAVMPSLSALSAGPVQVVHRAMQEFELLQHQGQAWLGLTLLRSVGWLSRRDLVTRGVGAGPDLATPGAQRLGQQRFDFRIASGLEIPALLDKADALRRPPLLLRGHGQAWHAAQQFDNSSLRVSALRRAGEELELRVWNCSDAEQAPQFAQEGWRPVRADGQPMDRMQVPAHGIATYRTKLVP
ncbi:hypothetical protein ABT392_08160 [Paucibacter sp. JuS9]|uniref:glycoside hydrolase family 38 N-terminal domain-containing protein n=1 Tax=Paucibacter sp. JuS9 TaxID=3228748 RepID=UPI00375712CE